MGWLEAQRLIQAHHLHEGERQRGSFVDMSPEKQTKNLSQIKTLPSSSSSAHQLQKPGTFFIVHQHLFNFMALNRSSVGCY